MVFRPCKEFGDLKQFYGVNFGDNCASDNRIAAGVYYQLPVPSQRAFDYWIYTSSYSIFAFVIAFLVHFTFIHII